jgi:pantoate--beta-alanine ligase
MRAWSLQRRRAGQTIAFVPTMGYFHEGHLELMREGRRHADQLAVSIFVNPAQFGPREDFDAYPRDLDRDLKMAGNVNVDVVFTPDRNDLYPEGYDTYINAEKLPMHLCGLSRPGHFRGVLTIVAKLFHIVNPHTAIFGQKDYQQLAIIRQMVKDFNFDIQIIGHPTIREQDGLAMSSRNVRLSPAQRISARCLYQSLIQAKNAVAGGETDSNKIIDSAVRLIQAHPETDIDYIQICDPNTLDDVSVIGRPVLMALAVKVGGTRLIDNMVLTPRSSYCAL